MSNSKHSASSKRRKNVKAKSRGKDAVALLRADHAEVSALFAKLEKTRSEAKKKDLAAEICIGLSVHMRIEEDIFYPAIKQALKEKDKELVPEARVEHATLKQLISQVEDASPDELFDARMQVMGEYVKHHVKEEQTEMFPKARASGVDLKVLGVKLAERKQELMSELGAKPGKAEHTQLPSSVFGEPLPAQHQHH